MGEYKIILIVAFILAIIGIWIRAKIGRFLINQTDKIMQKIKYNPNNPSEKQKFYGSLIILIILLVLLVIMYLLR